MKQILHIFRKDVRHHWIEILVSFALVVAYGYSEVRSWLMPANVSFGLNGIFGGAFLLGTAAFLLPIAWCFLVIRVIQDESLVGDKQFWVTRPYRWTQLFASKLLFALIFVSAPLLILQCYLLLKAGYDPFTYALGLFWMQLMFLVIVILPTALFATLTSTIARWLLALLAVGAYLVGTSWLGSLSRNSFVISDWTDSIIPPLLVCTAAMVILLQYARRATRKSVSLLAAAVSATLLLSVISPYDYSLAREYPSLTPGQGSLFRLALLPPAKSDGPSAATSKEHAVVLPLDIGGVSGDEIVNIGGVQVTFDGANGLHWVSGWTSMGAAVFPETSQVQARFSVDSQDLARLQQESVSVRLALAYSVYKDSDKASLVIPNTRFQLQELGWCEGHDIGVLSNSEISCLTPLREPTSLLITTEMSRSTCRVIYRDRVPASQIARDWIRGVASPGEFGISPLSVRNVQLSATDRAGSWIGAGLCPGTPIVVSHPREIGSHRVEIELGQVKLADYVQ